MTKEELNHYKKLLEKIKANLEKELKATPLVTDMGSDTEGETRDEETDEAEQMLNSGAVRFSFTERLAAVNSALDKIEKASYGKCEKCSKKIEKEILETDPESAYCKTCKSSS